MAANAAIVLFLALPFTLRGQPQLIEARRLSAEAPVSRIDGSSSGRIYFVSSETSERGWIDESPAGSYRTGGAGWGLEALDAPGSIWVDALSVLIADRNNNRIVRYDNDLRPISEFQTRDTSYAPARFSYPIAVAVNARGDLALLDDDSQELIVFDQAGSFLFRVGRDTQSGIRFTRPVDVCVSGRGTWLVLDSRRLTEVDQFGTLVLVEEHGMADPTAVDANDSWTGVASVASVQLHARGHRKHENIDVRMFSLSAPDARISDILMGTNTLSLVLDGVVVEYRLVGFEH